MGNVLIRELREGFEDESAERPWAPWSDGRMDGCEAIEVDEGAVGRVGFQDLEVGMVENNSAFFQGASVGNGASTGSTACAIAAGRHRVVANATRNDFISIQGS